jgi:hypothetical protein
MVVVPSGAFSIIVMDAVTLRIYRARLTGGNQAAFTLSKSIA